MLVSKIINVPFTTISLGAISSRLLTLNSKSVTLTLSMTQSTHNVPEGTLCKMLSMFVSILSIQSSGL